MSKEPKADVDYSRGMLHSHCGPMFHDDKFYCQHFTPSTRRSGTCELVEGGIEPDYWCKLYSRTKKR